MAMTIPALVYDNLKEGEGVNEGVEAQRFPQREIDELGIHRSGKGHDGADDRNKAWCCFCSRQKSVNEERERKNLLANSRSHEESVIDISNSGNSSASKSSSSQTVTGSRAEWTCGSVFLLILVSALIGCLLSCAVIIPVFYMSRPSTFGLLAVPSVNEMKTSQEHWHERYTDNEDHSKPVGRFVLDQNSLMEYGLLRWKESEQTAGSRVHSSRNESCVVVPEAGLYRVYSQITFTFDGRTTRSEVAHSVLVRKGEDENMVQKKLISVPFRDPALPERQQIMEPSNLITSAKVAVSDRICIEVSPVDLVYKSQVDNVLMVVKEE
ncbi:tumor necrosis factor-like [Mya arenaria]|nr:tumor necrosis factor-like [Mya arenaria]XP_052794654.1 tumor necrosis factor-like [Mya arenaria]